MDASLVRALVLLSVATAVIAALLLLSLKLRRDAAFLREDLARQRKDTLRSVNFMMEQMEYDGEVLRLLRHARNSREAGREAECLGALDELARKEGAMLERVDRMEEFETYLKRTYRRGRSASGGKGKGGGSRPSDIREDIRTFTRAIEEMKRGDTAQLREKIAFFEKWVESPEREEMLSSLRAMADFLERGDSLGLSALKERSGKGGGGAEGGVPGRGRAPGAGKGGEP